VEKLSISENMLEAGMYIEPEIVDRAIKSYPITSLLTEDGDR
jgi:hypothetical protein